LKRLNLANGYQDPYVIKSTHHIYIIHIGIKERMKEEIIFLRRVQTFYHPFTRMCSLVVFQVGRRKKRRNRNSIKLIAQ